VFAILNSLPFNCDLGIGHMRCFVQAANDNGHAIVPALAWLTGAHRDALLGLSDNDARKRAYLACAEVDMGEVTATGAYAISKQATLAAASAARRKIEGHGHV
jgi:hypothetical protein